MKPEKRFILETGKLEWCSFVILTYCFRAVMVAQDMTPSTELCEDTNSKWKNMLRNTSQGAQEKPQWRAAVKVRSPSERSFHEGGSLRTNRNKVRGRSENQEKRRLVNKMNVTAIYGECHLNLGLQIFWYSNPYTDKISIDLNPFISTDWIQSQA